MKNSLILASTLFITLSHSMTAKADIPVTHGMVIFGDSTTYASHLHMFHAPHDQQAVFEIVLENSGRKPTVELYEELKKNKNGQGLFTILPRAFDLSELIATGSGRITATLYDGHFEKGGTPVGPLDVHVSKVIYSQKLSKDSSPNADFVVFGSGVEHYAVKKIGAVGSYDAIVSVEHPEKYQLTGCYRRLCDGDSLFSWVKISDVQLPVTLKAVGLIPANDYQFKIPSKGVVLSDEKVLKGNAPLPPCNPCQKTTIKEVIYASKDDLSH